MGSREGPEEAVAMAIVKINMKAALVTKGTRNKIQPYVAIEVDAKLERNFDYS